MHVSIFHYPQKKYITKTPTYQRSVEVVDITEKKDEQINSNWYRKITNKKNIMSFLNTYIFYWL